MKLDVQGQGGGRILDVMDGEGGVLKTGQFSWTSCASPLTWCILQAACGVNNLIETNPHARVHL